MKPLLGFTPECFVDRRARLRPFLGDGILVLSAAPVLHRSRDTEYRYRPDSELFYLSGCIDPGVVAVFRDAEEDGFVIFVPRRDPKSEIWSGSRPGPEEARDLLHADTAYELEELEERLPGLLQQKSRIFFRLGTHYRVEALVRDALRWGRGRGPRTGTGPRALVDPGQLLDGLRLVKDVEEVERIREAARVTAAAFRRTLGATRPGLGEWDLEALLESAFRRGGAAGPAFPTIVGSGGNGCILHYSANRDPIREGDLILLDGGAELDLYSGDVTRTYPVSGGFSPSQLEVYRVVLSAHEAALSMVRPGSTVARIHEAALEKLTVGLVELGILKGRVENLLEEKASEAFFPHQTSHWLGLDVHDVGDYASKSGSRVLEAGMVLTVEPGLYLPSSGGTLPTSFGGIGIRIEDDVLVTPEGYENLTADLPVAALEVEAMVGAGVREWSTS